MAGDQETDGYRGPGGCLRLGGPGDAAVTMENIGDLSVLAVSAGVWSLSCRLHDMDGVLHAPASDRVRANTWPAVNDRLDHHAQLRLREAAASTSSDDLTRQITTLENEWNFDRVLETEASLMGLVGVVLGTTVDKRFLVLPGFVATMLLLHATHGVYPFLPLFRRMGVRSQDEIDRERYGLKALRGDFTPIPPAGSPAGERASAAWKAVCA